MISSILMTCRREDANTAGTGHLLAELRNQAIKPSSDLLLHDMGTGLADNYVEGQAQGGLGRQQAVRIAVTRIDAVRYRALLEQWVREHPSIEQRHKTARMVNDGA